MLTLIKKTTVPIKTIKPVAIKTQSTSIKYHKSFVFEAKNIYFVHTGYINNIFTPSH